MRRKRRGIEICGSPAATVVNEQGGAVGAFRRPGWKLQVAELASGFAYFEGRRGNRDDPRDGSITVEHGQRFAISDGSEVFAEARLRSAMRTSLMTNDGHLRS
jgi:hypothetical protein